MNILLEQAEQVITTARQAASKRGEVAALAIVDTGGNLVAFSRMNGAYLITIDTAIGKAYTAIALNTDTANIQPLVEPGQILYNLPTVTQQPRPPVPFAGGILLYINGNVVGALGVSGARTSQTDHEIAQEGSAIL